MSTQTPAFWLVVVVVSVASCIGCGGHAGNQTTEAPKTKVSREAMDFHECITSGSLEELRKALTNGADVNLRGRNGETPLMVAIAAKDVEKMQLLVESGADPELTDDFNGTALSHAVSWDFADGVRFLLDLGVDRGYSPNWTAPGLMDISRKAAFWA